MWQVVLRALHGIKPENTLVIAIFLKVLWMSAYAPIATQGAALSGMHARILDVLHTLTALSCRIAVPHKD